MIQLDQGRARLQSTRCRRGTELRFAALSSDEAASEDPTAASCLRQARLERLASGALHLLKANNAILCDGPVCPPPHASYWPLPQNLVLDADVLRAGDVVIGRHDAMTDRWFYDQEHLRELTILLQPPDSAAAPLAQWAKPNLFARAPAPAGDGAVSDTFAHDRLYVAQLSGWSKPDIKPKDLLRTRVLQVDVDNRRRLAEAPRVRPWTGHRPPTVRLALIGSSRVDRDSGDLKVSDRDPAALAALAVEAMRELSLADGLECPPKPSHISLISCYLDNGAFEPFGARFLKEAAGPAGFNDPGLTVSLRTNAIRPGEDDERGRLKILGPGGDHRHRQPGGTMRLNLLVDQVRTVPKVLEDGRSFVIDRGQQPDGLLGWWDRRAPAAGTPATGVPAAFQMGEVAATLELLDRMGAVEVDGRPLRAPDARPDAPGAFPTLRFDAARLLDFLSARSSPADLVQGLRLLRQCQRTGREPLDLLRGLPDTATTCAEVLRHVGMAVSEDLMVPPTLWAALWPSGQVPELPARPDWTPWCSQDDPQNGLRAARNAYVLRHIGRKKRQASELKAAESAYRLE